MYSSRVASAACGRQRATQGGHATVTTVGSCAKKVPARRTARGHLASTHTGCCRETAAATAHSANPIALASEEWCLRLNEVSGVGCEVGAIDIWLTTLVCIPDGANRASFEISVELSTRFRICTWSIFPEKYLNW